jgi:hypothetical protein
LLLTEEADRLGRDSGFIQRKRQVSGRSFAQAMVFGFQANPDMTYSELCQSSAMVGVEISEQGIEQRMNRKAAQFLSQLLERAVRTVITAERVSQAVLDRFAGVFIRDSSVISLPRELRDNWKGVGDSVGESAAMKLHICLNYSTGQLFGPVIQDGCMHDQRSPYQEMELPAGALRLADLGYYDLDQLAEDHRRNIYWITRLKIGTIIYDARGEMIDLQTWLSNQSQGFMDEWVYVGKKQRLACRLITQRVPQEVADQRRRRLYEYARKKQVPVQRKSLALAQWTLVITNVPSELLTGKEVLTLLRIRWQIELLFKLWKSYAKVDEWRSCNPWRILCEIYAKLIGLVVTQWMFTVGLWQYPERSLFRAMKIIRKYVTVIAIVFNNQDQLEWILNQLMSILPVGSRMDKRVSHPNAYQLLLPFTGGLN